MYETVLVRGSRKKKRKDFYDRLFRSSHAPNGFEFFLFLLQICLKVTNTKSYIVA